MPGEPRAALWGEIPVLAYKNLGMRAGAGKPTHRVSIPPGWGSVFPINHGIVAQVGKPTWELVVKTPQLVPRCHIQTSLPGQFKAHRAVPSASPSPKPSTDLHPPGRCRQGSPRAGEQGATGVTGKGQGSHLADFPAVLPEHEVGVSGHLPHHQLLRAAQGAGRHLPQGHADVVDGEQDLLVLERRKACGPGAGRGARRLPGGSAHTTSQSRVPWCSPYRNDKPAQPLGSSPPTCSGFSGEIKQGEDQALQSIHTSQAGQERPI